MDIIYNYKLLISLGVSLLFSFIYYKYSELKIIKEENDIEENLKKIKNESIYLFIFLFLSIAITLYSTDNSNNNVMNHIKQGEPPF
jgi:hypothetical protein